MSAEKKPVKSAWWKHPVTIMIGIPATLIVGFVAYAVISIHWAANKVDSFCAAVQVGDPIAGLKERAKASGMKAILIRPEDGKPGTLTVVDGWAFARRICELTYESEKIISKSSSSLD